ncbi:hypothetical protein IHE61_11250 [Streptomyces sp. GKU 257-1]|nr:hypothetical protein [Streptomyces sp. GKU 257-1]
MRTRRTFGDLLKACGAFLALAVLVAGVPAALAYFIGWPLPHRMPTPDMLREEVSAGVFIDVLTVVVWLAWAQFTACVLVEVKGALSGVGLPVRVPGAGPSQLLARQLGHRGAAAGLQHGELRAGAGPARSPCPAAAARADRRQCPTPAGPAAVGRARRAAGRRRCARHGRERQRHGGAGRRRWEGRRCGAAVRGGVLGAGGADEVLPHPASGGPAPRLAVGDRRAAPGRRAAVQGDLPAQQGPGAAGRFPALRGEPHPARLDHGDARRRARRRTGRDAG